MFDKNTPQLKINSSIIFFFIALILVIILYENTLKVPFIFDDIPDIVENNSLHWHRPLTFSKITDSLISHRPLSNLTFGLNYYFGKLDVKGYHLVNIFLHLFNTLLLFIFLKLILNLGLQEKDRGQSVYLAFIISLLWTASPVQTQAVNYIVQRMTLLAALFYLLGLTCYIKARTKDTTQKILWFILTFLFGGMALLSKENTVVFPIICLFVEYFFISKFQRNEFKKFLIKSSPFYVLTVILILIYLFRHPGISDIFSHRSSSQEFTIWERVMTEWRVLVYYLSLLLLPLSDRLSLDYLFPVSKTLFQPITTFSSLILIAVLIGWAIKKAKEFPLISFGIIWFFINLFVESTLIPIDLVFEHRLYVPSIGFFVVAIILAYQVFIKINLSSFKMIGYALVFFLIFFEGHYTIERNKDWQDPLTLWTQTVQQFPNLARAHLSLGLVYEQREEYSQAEKEFLQAIQLRPKDPFIYNNYGALLWKKGELTMAELEFKKSLSFKPDLIEARLNLGKLYGHSGNPDSGIKEINEILKNNKNNIKSFIVLGELYESKNQLDLAKENYLNALQLNQNDLESLNHLGRLSLKNHFYQEALTYFKQAVVIEPDFDYIHQQLGIVYQDKGMFNEAFTEFIKTYELNPQNKTVHYNLGSLFYQIGQLEMAISEYEKAVEVDPRKEALPSIKEILSSTNNSDLRNRAATLINKITVK